MSTVTPSAVNAPAVMTESTDRQRAARERTRALPFDLLGFGDPV